MINTSTMTELGNLLNCLAIDRLENKSELTDLAICLYHVCDTPDIGETYLIETCLNSTDKWSEDEIKTLWAELKK